MHHDYPMPCLILGNWGEHWVICVCENIEPLVFFWLFIRLKATFLGICQCLSIAESSKRLGYPLSMSCFLISWSIQSLFSGSLQILIIIMLRSFEDIFKNGSLTQWMTRVLVEQPWLYPVCQLSIFTWCKSDLYLYSKMCITQWILYIPMEMGSHYIHVLLYCDGISFTFT